MNRIETLLGILAEECIEVAHRAIKAQRFGINQKQLDQPYTNAERITLELNDVYAVVALIRKELEDLHFGATLIELIDKKREKVERYMDPNRDLLSLDKEYHPKG